MSNDHSLSELFSGESQMTFKKRNFFQWTNSKMLFIFPLEGFVFHECCLTRNNKPHEATFSFKGYDIDVKSNFTGFIVFQQYNIYLLLDPNQRKMVALALTSCACYGLKPKAINLGLFPAGFPSFSATELTMGLVWCSSDSAV